MGKKKAMPQRTASKRQPTKNQLPSLHTRAPASKSTRSIPGRGTWLNCTSDQVNCGVTRKQIEIVTATHKNINLRSKPLTQFNLAELAKIKAVLKAD